MRKAFIAALAALACGCAVDAGPAPHLVLGGPLAAWVERTPPSLAVCAPNGEARECMASLDDGVQYVAVGADTVVTEATREWLLPESARAAAWEREAARLTSAFGPPARERRPPGDTAAVREAHARWRGWCSAWRADSVEVVLRLDPLVDVGTVRDSVDWRLSRWLRRGALPDAIACGLHRPPAGETAPGATP